METIYYSDLKIEDLPFINELLEKGGIIAFPTETVYGLGAFISNDEAIKKIYILKNRPLEKALTVHFGSAEQVYIVAEDIPEDFFLLSQYFLPGPLTMVLKKKSSVSRLVSAYDTVAVRIPSHPTALKFLKTLKEPIIGTSANISSQKDPISMREVSVNFHNKIECIIDGGICNVGIPSTILNLVGEIKIIRKGTISKEHIEQVLHKKILTF
jgi:L-threonylcarbamoyladenylate synthase